MLNTGGCTESASGLRPEASTSRERLDLQAIRRSIVAGPIPSSTGLLTRSSRTNSASVVAARVRCYVSSNITASRRD